MKWNKLYLISAVLLAAIIGVGAIAKRHGVALAGGTSYLIEENFEGPGYENSQTEAGTPDDQYATSPAPLEGSYSWQGTGATDSAYVGFTDTDGETWLYFMVNFADIADQAYSCGLYDSSGNRLVQLRVLSTGAARAYIGTVYQATTGSFIDSATTYHIWLRYVKGTGANAEVHLYKSTDTTRPASPDVSKTNGTVTADAARVYCFPTVINSGVIIDKIRVSSTEIDSDP